MDILADKLEFYQLMSKIFFDRLTHAEKIDALLEVSLTLKYGSVDQC